MTTSSRTSLALLHGRLDPASGESGSLLIENETIACIATAEEVLCRAGSGTAIYDLEERILSPGFVDAHMHFHSLGVRAARPSLSAARSLDEAIEIVRASSHARGEVLVAEGWDETKWKSPERPTRRLLDAALPDRATVLRRVCGHAGAANTPALRWLEEHWGSQGIDFETGTLLEHPILSLDGLLPRTREEEDEAFEAAARQCFSFGVTTASDFPRPDSFRAYAVRLTSGPLPLPVHAYLIDPEDHWDSLLGGTSRENFRIHGIKLFSDGSIGARTAAMFEDYADRPGAQGDLLLDASSMAKSIHAAHGEGLAVAVHAIGDRAIAEVLAAYACSPQGESAARGDRLEHFELPRDGDAEQLARLGVRPCMQPNFIAEWGMPGAMYERALGVERVRAMNPLRSVLRAGCGLFFGSDGMPLSPLYGIRAAMSHPVEAERLDARESQALYTHAGAQAFGEERIGLVREGWRADLAVLPRGVSFESAGRDTTVDLTIAAGRIVHATGAVSAFVSPREAR